MLTALIRRFGGAPAFRIYGKAKPESAWREIDVFATHRRDCVGGWPVLSGYCITWSARIIGIGWDFAEGLLREQIETPASRDTPVEVPGGRLRFGRDSQLACAGPHSEVMAHECGHTYQAVRLGLLYLPAGALFTWWREGPHWWNRFENRASERGQFGGIVKGSVHPDLWERVAWSGGKPIFSDFV